VDDELTAFSAKSSTINYCFRLHNVLSLNSTMIVLHSENSTATPEWHANATKRGTWAIYQSCIVTIFLCVWTTIHLNVPRPHEKKHKQLWRRFRWSFLTVIAPEIVALNAWWVVP
jgi:hypothetical protein